MRIDSTMDEGFPVFWFDNPDMYGFVRGAAALAVVTNAPGALEARRASIDALGAPDFGFGADHTGVTLAEFVAANPL